MAVPISLGGIYLAGSEFLNKRVILGSTRVSLFLIPRNSLAQTAISVRATLCIRLATRAVDQLPHHRPHLCDLSAAVLCDCSRQFVSEF